MSTQRIPPLAPSDFSPEVLAITRGMRAAAGLPPTDEIDNYVATVLRHPSLFRRHFDLAMALMADGALPARDRELVVLRVAWLCQSPFEWGEHVAMGKRAAGLTAAEIDRVTHGPDAPGWAAGDAAILRAVDEMHAQGALSDTTWDALAARFDDRQLLELPILFGQYHGIACLLNTLRIPLLPGNEGLSAR